MTTVIRECATIDETNEKFTEVNTELSHCIHTYKEQLTEDEKKTVRDNLDVVSMEKFILAKNGAKRDIDNLKDWTKSTIEMLKNENNELRKRTRILMAGLTVSFIMILVLALKGIGVF